MPSPFRAYVSHKRVEAARIVSLAPSPTMEAGNKIVVTLEDGTLEVEPIVFARHFPDPGDYLVRYADGYLSVSPRAAFEEGYRLAPVIVAAEPESPDNLA